MDDAEFIKWCKQRGIRFDYDDNRNEYTVRTRMTLDDLQKFYIDVQEYEANKQKEPS